MIYLIWAMLDCVLQTDVCITVGQLTSVQEVRPGVYKILFPESANAVVPLRAHSGRPT